ncbi:MAG TPA: DUF6445 family protein [Steroidobacteraceae bacterium]|jgi:hypothetical protein|nr:DUF6445 family protein [Steroidobacteraceae bacterium]
MILNLHRDIRIQKLEFGAEKATLLVIDNFVAEPERLIRRAANRQFTVFSRFYPGIRTEAPPSYEEFLIRALRPLFIQHFGLASQTIKFPMRHYSLVTTPAAKLEFLQRIPHFDSLGANGLATVHYLFKRDLGGTAFYRHRKTGFEYIDESRRDEYFKVLEDERQSKDSPGAEYINGDTPLFEQIAKQDGVFNRMLIYRRNSLHSGCIGKEFIPDLNPATGRLSINCFIDFLDQPPS